MRGRREEVGELHTQLEKARREASAAQGGRELELVRGELRGAQRQLEEERHVRRRLEGELVQLRTDMGGLEALVGGRGDDSMVQLGLSGAGEASGAGGSLRIREELHRSLVGNRTKREEINKLEVSRSRLESSLRSREVELEELRGMEAGLRGQVEELRSQVTSLHVKRDSCSEQEGEVGLQEQVKLLEHQNSELKKHLSEMAAANDADRQEAIEELREEYEEQVQEAVQGTRHLMEGEVRRLQLELEVYTATLLEIRNNLTKETDKNAELLGKILKLEKSLVDQESDAEKKRVRFERSSMTAAEVSEETMASLRAAVEQELAGRQEQELAARLQEVRKELETEVKVRLEQELATRLQEVEKEAKERQEQELAIRLQEVEKEVMERQEQEVATVRLSLRASWEEERRVECEEAVARARLDWIRRLPEVERGGGAVRESLGEVERVRGVLERERGERGRLEREKTEQEVEIRRLGLKEKEAERRVQEGRREARKEVEERLGRELREALVRQQEQWERMVRVGREEAEVLRGQVVEQWQGQVEVLEGRLRRGQEEREELEGRLREEQVERVRREGEGSSSRANQGLLREELERRGEEVARQRQEMAGLVARWREEMEGIQQSHQQERGELEEVTDKYRGLKAKVRRYQRHCEAKEEHYRAEYARLEAEFRSTLETLKGRMEVAYTAKEQQVSLAAVCCTLLAVRCKL